MCVHLSTCIKLCFWVSDRELCELTKIPPYPIGSEIIHQGRFNFRRAKSVLDRFLLTNTLPTTEPNLRYTTYSFLPFALLQKAITLLLMHITLIYRSWYLRKQFLSVRHDVTVKPFYRKILGTSSRQEKKVLASETAGCSTFTFCWQNTRTRNEDSNRLPSGFRSECKRWRGKHLIFYSAYKKHKQSSFVHSLGF